ncbi:hypothetical protein [Malonomonas rubra]|uniref:hypothetical protein n=1 Tax=Malonomonas rubra TaxID=57040 RepID=UPI0026E98EBD|nr:hypothetical protein [Malonomonas rubra]
MLQIVQKEINVAFPPGHHQHCLVCQIPSNLLRRNGTYCVADPAKQWAQVRAIFELVARGDSNLKKLHFLFLPESIMPLTAVDEALTMIEQRFRSNTVTIFGVEHISLTEFRRQLQKYADDNADLLKTVDEDLDAGDVDDVPVNWCVIAVKEDSGRLRVFFEAKSHPFVGEENLDRLHDLYRGKIFWLFRCHPTCFNFMSLICLDYIYRDLYQSNINAIIDKANQLFFETRQRLDLLAIIECNPKPEHKAFRDVLNGFYGEYLGYTPGVRDASTIFCNVASGTSCEGLAPRTKFGRSAIILHESHHIERRSCPEFAIDNFSGLPVCRLRFGTQARLYYFNLPLFHELDPRTSRMPVKIHSIYRPDMEGNWVRMIGDELTGTDSCSPDRSGKSL